MSKFSVKFWGTRGSYATPGETTLKYGGNTTCVEIETDHSLLIIDAGTGIIDLGKKIVKEGKFKNINIMFTHTHKDHTEGFPSFLPAYLGQYRINIYGPKAINTGIEDVIANSMNYSYFPVQFEEMGSLKSAVNVKETEIIVIKENKSIPIVYNKYHSNYEIGEKDIVVKLLKNYNHPRNGVYVYRIEYMGKSFVFATDVESYVNGDTKLIKLAKEADVLVHDAAYDSATYIKKQGWGHSTSEMAAENAIKANVGRLYLTHHDPEDREEDIEKKCKIAKESFKESFIAYEGLEIDMLNLK